MSYGIVETLITVAVTAAAAAASSAAAADVAANSQPTLAGDAAPKAEAATLPARRALAAAAQQGKAVTAQTGRTVTRQVKTDKDYISLWPAGAVQKAGSKRNATWRMPDGSMAVPEQVEYVAAEWQPGGKYYNSGRIAAGPVVHSPTIEVTEPETISADFTGYGDADVQAKIADQVAAQYRDLSDKYGLQYVAEAKKQLEQADPEGTQARKLMLDIIQQQIADEPQRPVADTLDRQVGEELTAGNRMARDAAGTLASATAAANASRGDALKTSLLQAQMESGAAGQARADAARQKSLGWLTSGATPEDTAYRREQQNLANLSAFGSGQTPVTQFGQLSGAQQGATPMRTGAALPTVNPNATQAATQFGLNNWQTRVQSELSQTPSWLTGMTGALNMGQVIAAGSGTK